MEIGDSQESLNQITVIFLIYPYVVLSMRYRCFMLVSDLKIVLIISKFKNLNTENTKYYLTFTKPTIFYQTEFPPPPPIVLH